MDSEEAIKIREATHAGRPETDEGPYYHEAWWEAYKGSIKGTLGGLFVGSGVGAAIGATTGLALALIAGVALTPASFALLVLSFTALGAYKGAHEFSEVGVVTGAVSAAHEKSEERMKEFESAKFAELKQEIRSLKGTVGTDAEKPPLDGPSCDEIAEKHAGYRTSHCDAEHCETPRRFVFWKVATIGLLAGALFGALFGAAGAFTEFMHPVTTALGITGQGQLVAASAIVGGAVGGSFGLNRDLFREIFDVTDHWFKGIFIPTKHHGESKQQRIETERVLIEPSQQYAENETYFRDKVSAETGRKALFSMDHTNSVRH